MTGVCRGARGPQMNPCGQTPTSRLQICAHGNVIALKEEEGLPPEEQEGVGGASFPAHNAEAPPQTLWGPQSSVRKPTHNPPS